MEDTGLSHGTSGWVKPPTFFNYGKSDINYAPMKLLQMVNYFTMLLNSLGRRRIWGLENYNIKAYRACHLDVQPYSLTGPGIPWRGGVSPATVVMKYGHGGGQGQALCYTQAARRVQPHPRPRLPVPPQRVL